jgi:two-component system nitrogen regulation response regulator GlnG
LQDGRFERVGGNKTIETDVRIIAATNQDLEKLIADGRFRQDLFYRLKVFSVCLPPLRERVEDLPMLVDHLLALFSHELGKDVRSVSDETMRLLKSCDWPGNVRELQGALKYAMVNAQGDVIVPDHLPAAFRGSGQRTDSASLKLDVLKMVRKLLDEGQVDIYQTVRDAVDRAVFKEVLNGVQGNQVEASRLLGISRTTLHNKLNTLGLALEKQVRSDSGHPDQKADKL